MVDFLHSWNEIVDILLILNEYQRNYAVAQIRYLNKHYPSFQMIHIIERRIRQTNVRQKTL